MQYSIEVRAAYLCIEVINYNAGCGTKHTAAYIVKSDIDGKFNYFITEGMTDAEILTKRDAMRFDSKGIYNHYYDAVEKALSIVNSVVNRASVLEVWADAANAILQNEAIEAIEAFAYDSSRPYSHVQVCELAGLPLQASVYIHTHSSGDHSSGDPLAVAVKGDKDEYGFYSASTYLGFVSNWRNAGMYIAALSTEDDAPMLLGDFKTTLEAQAALLRAVCDTIEAWAAAAHASIAIQPTPENADTNFEYEALSAGRAFDAPSSVLNKQYVVPAELCDIETLIDEIAADEYEDLAAIDSEIADLQARLMSLGSTRQDIVEEYAYWRGKCERAAEIAEYAASYEANEADADLRQSVWFATGQDIM